jgi:hypothetical protein
MGGPEHQICLSKGVIGKYVLCKNLGPQKAVSRNRKSHRNGGFWCFGPPVWRLIYIQCSELGGVIWQFFGLAPGDGSKSDLLR